MFWCVHHIIIDNDGYYESIKACSSKETAKKLLNLQVKGKSLYVQKKKKVKITVLCCKAVKTKTIYGGKL